MKLNISTEVAELISHIADVQIKALLNIQQGNYQIDEEDQELLMQYQATIQTVQREAKGVISHFQDMKREPLLIGITSNQFLSIMRHILFRIEEEYPNKQAVIQLWDIFFYIERERTPEIKLMVKSNKKQNNGKSISINNNRIRRSKDNPVSTR